MTTIYEIQLRADTAANWSTDDPVLGAAEPGLDITNGIWKVGDGTTGWNSLPPYGSRGLLAPCVCGTNGSETFTIASGTVTQIAGTVVDGASPGVGDRILVKDAPAASGAGSGFSNQPGNGVYVVTSNTTNLTLARAVDMSGVVNPAGLCVAVMSGFDNAIEVFMVDAPNSNATFTYGSGAIEWTIVAVPFPIDAASAITLSNKTYASPILTPYDAIFAGTARTWEIGSFGSANYLGVESSDTGDSPDIYSGGTDASIHIGFTPKGTGRVQVHGVNVPTVSSTDTLTNKRVTPRDVTVTAGATPSINTDNGDYFEITGLATNITSMTTNLTGTPTRGQKLWISITGTAARTITWGGSFEASTVTAPTTTVGTARIDVGFIWNSVTSKWRCVGTC